MTFNSRDWNGPHNIITPNIQGDIEKYFNSDILTKYNSCTNQNIKKKIEFITERLEFIEGLKTFATYIRMNTQNHIINRGNFIENKFEYEFINFDFAGFDYDIEALNYYLYLSCIDAIQSQPKFHSAFEWIINNIDKYKNKDSLELLNIFKNTDEEYSEKYGLSKNFRKAFTEDITDKLQDELCEVLMVVKMSNNKITEESIEAWEERDLQKKLSKIAEVLYNQRSKFTHSNIRSFLPSLPINIMCKNDGVYLLCKKGKDINLLLHQVIKEVCLKKLNENVK